MSRKILVIGAGKSTSYLLDYLLEKADSENLFLTIGDLNPGIVPDEIKNDPSCKVIRLDIFEDDERDMAIKNSDIVISMLPARFHIKVAEDCIRLKKHMVTASYVSEEIKKLYSSAKKKGLVFMN